MTDYTIAAIPTVYRGRRYRSRLEARWAAFFDLLGWRHEYEPFDLGPWSPDFLLTDWRTLVEIKPRTEFAPEVWAKAKTAVEAKQGVGSQEDAPVNAIFLSDLAPGDSHGAGIAVGWIGFVDKAFSPMPASIGWLRHRHQPTIYPELVGISLGGWNAASGDASLWPAVRHDGWLGDYPYQYPDYTMQLWARATGAVQWQPGEARP